MSSFSGRCADAGYGKHTVFVGSSLIVIGTFMTSLANSYWQILLTQGVCTGIGAGLLYMPAFAVISTYFKKRRVVALALAASGSGTGSIMFPLIVQYLQPQIGR